MADSRLFPYYFPTTVIFVDDNPSFLQSLALQLPEDLAFQMYERPERALAVINADKTSTPLYERCFSHYRDAAIDPSSERLIHLDLSIIEREVSNANRFQEISVVVVDYDMPSMDGLEFCKRIRDPRIKKVLFTGVADEKIAVSAFNDGIIDRFIIKNENDAPRLLNDTVDKLQRRFFEDISHTLRTSLLLDAPPFLTDPAFEEMFEDLRDTHKFVEYYLVANPSGFLLLTDRGDLFRLVVLSDREVEAQMAWSREADAPAAVVDAFASRNVVGYFYEPMDDYADAGDYEWTEYLFDARRLDGASTWYWALIEQPPVDIDFDEEHANYHAYLERLDAGAAA